MTPLAIDPLAGPVCDTGRPLPSCYHDSCGTIEMTGRVTFAEGPLCAAADYLGECPHGSCAQADPDQSWCARHGAWVLVTETGAGPGYAGGRIWWASLACGCTEMDESADIAAAC